MKLTNGEVTLDLENENHIAAFLSSGYTEVKEKQVSVPEEDKPVKKSVTKKKDT